MSILGVVYARGGAKRYWPMNWHDGIHLFIAVKMGVAICKFYGFSFSLIRVQLFLAIKNS